MGQGSELIKTGIIKWLSIMGKGSVKQGITNVLTLLVETQKTLLETKEKENHNAQSNKNHVESQKQSISETAPTTEMDPYDDQSILERMIVLPEHQRARELFDEIRKYLSERIPGTTASITPVCTHYCNDKHEEITEGNYTIKTPENSKHNYIWIDLDEEITFGFSDWHSHFSFSDDGVKSFYYYLNAIINNELCAACSYYNKLVDGSFQEFWGGSTLLSEDKLTQKDLYDEFGHSKRITCSFWDATKDIQMRTTTDMTEITDDRFNAFLEICDDCVLDYCIMKSQECYTSLRLHKEAIGFALETCGRKYEMTFKMDIEKARAECIDAEDFLSVPNVPWFKKTAGGGGFIKEIVGEKLKYWFAFLEPPYGASPIIQNHKVIRRGLSVDDFHKMNQLLFPNGAESLTVYEWTTDWSDYFDDGHEWWGAACWSIYDKSLNRYVVILASASD